jgi:predicted transcriptional regulator of viral defense system
MSNRELTFIDLIYFEKHIGGLNRIVSELDELREGIKVQYLKEVVKNEFPLTVFQKAGFILDHHFKLAMFSAILEKRLRNENIRITPLNPSGINTGEVDDKRKVQVNIELESEV